MSSGRRSGLERALRDAVRSGRLAPEVRLPATRVLAVELGLSRGTVRAAYDQLIAEGYLAARPGSGTVVAHRPQRQRDIRRRDRMPAAVRHDLRPGSPDPSTFPTAAWLRSARRALSVAPADAYGYGDPRGRIELRTALAEYLGRARGVLAHPDLVVISNGYVQALALLISALGETGATVTAMEDPGSAFHRDVVRRNGSTIVPLPVDHRGARTDLLGSSGFPPVGAVEVTPAHQYPTGETLHPTRRRALAEWARFTGGLVIENDYDGEFRYDRQPVGSIQGTCPEHVAYLGTVSKTLGPGLRIGWMVLPPRLVEPVVEAKRHSDHHTETIGQLTLADMITSHAYDRHVRACRLRYRHRRDVLLSDVAASGFPVHGIAAGLHALIRLPAGGPTESDVLRVAEEHGLAVGCLGTRWHAPGDHPQGLVVGYGTPREHAYPAALDALAQVLRAARHAH
ncbi:MAG: PLP-dependent aminotransferase family protein [Kutzneria sp.]|nr:PLP-dependent aminotransferase family protein [Kutzneria sp.]MBV9844224.1 PLP-dependent aminotransferase family protein [Kutzneria sp.]